jgi:GNAT superfamily N-acetyltransferase
MVITVSEEKVVDYELTSRIATEAFGSSGVVFVADRMKWLYERGFGQGTTVLAAAEDGLKIGQIALLHQTIHCGGEPCSAIQLVDLFISKDHRSTQLIRRLYKEVEQLCAARNIRFILGVPNQNAMLLNARFLKLEPLMWLQIRVGIALKPPRRSKLQYSGYFKSLATREAIDLLSGFNTPETESGLRWDGEILFNRISDPTQDYAVHASTDLVLISSFRRTRGVGHTLLCGFFVRSPATAASRNVRELVRAACHFWKRPLFVYAGVNDKLPTLPGIPLPARLRSPMLVQWRDLGAEKRDMRFDRFQLIDSDFV